MTKKLDVTAITNELSEGSAFFRASAKPVEAPASPPAPLQPRELVKATLPNHQQQKLKAQTPGRPLIRRTFDLFEDQLNYLNRESLQDRLAGKESSMNAMLREALDEWITKRKTAK